MVLLCVVQRPDFCSSIPPFINHAGHDPKRLGIGYVTSERSKVLFFPWLVDASGGLPVHQHVA